MAPPKTLLLAMTKVPGKPPKRNKGYRKAGTKEISAEPRVDRKKMAVVNLTTPADDVQYWLTRSPAERLAHLEYLRLINYGQAAVSGRLKRVLEIAQLRPS